MPPSFRVNNLLLWSLLESGILLDSNTAKESKKILEGAINTTASTPFSSEFCCYQQFKLPGDEP
jgi:hypothetical protein